MFSVLQHGVRMVRVMLYVALTSAWAPVWVYAGDADAIAAKAMEAYKAGDVRAARDSYQKAAEASPQTEKYFVNAALLSEELGEADTAADWFMRAAPLAARRGDLETLSSYNVKLFDLRRAADQPKSEKAIGRLSDAVDRASQFEKKGDFKAALEVRESSCIEISRLFGNLHPEYSKCQHRRALLLSRLGRYAEAIQVFDLALQVRRASFGEVSLETQQSRMQRADALRLMGDLATARKELEASLKILKDAGAGDIPAAFDAKGILAKVAEASGDLAIAAQLQAEVLVFEKKSLGDEHPNVAATISNLGDIQYRLGKFTQAEQNYRDSLQSYVALYGKAHPFALSVTNNLALVLEQQGLYDQAEPLYRDALQSAKTVLGEAHPTTLAYQNNLAMLHESQGLFEKARGVYEGAIAEMRKTLGAQHPDTLAMRNNLGYLLMLMGAYAEAKPIFDAVRVEWQKTLGEQHPRTLKALNNLARTHHYSGDLKGAEALMRKALELRSAALGPEHIDTLRSMHDLGALLRDQGRLSDAEALLNQALKLDEQVLGKLHPYTLETLNTLASVHEQDQQWLRAFPLRQRLFERRSKFLDRMLWATGENAREGMVRLHRPELDAFLELVTRMPQDQGGRQAFMVGLKRKGILLRVASEIQQVARLSGDTALSALAQELAESRKRLAELTLAGPTDATRDHYLALLNQLETRIDELQGELGRGSARYREVAIQPDVVQLLSAIPADSTLVEFLSYRAGNQDRLLAAVMSRQGKNEPEIRFVTYADMDAVNASIGKLRKIIQDEDASDDEVLEVGQAAYALIWKPLTELMDGIKTVYVVPDGLLNILPFNAMADAEGEWLLKTTNVHVLSSSRDLLPSKLPVAKGEMLILAGPDYDAKDAAGVQARKLLETTGTRQAMRGAGHGMRGLNFDPLPGAEKEGGLIAEKAQTGKQSVQAFFKRDAAEIRLHERKTPPAMLHVATHGFFLKPDESLKKRLSKLQRGGGAQLPPPGDNPLLRAGLAFTGINVNAPYLGEIDTRNDGVLTALEVLSLDLSGTQVVTLSACETGLGEIHEGEGVYGLRRSFQEAGARSVINSLWEVSDAGTQALMTGFYSRLVKGDTAHHALRQAQLEMLASGRWSAPYIWSAFFMVERN